MTRSILVLGATGLVGGEALRLLLDDPAFGRVVVLSRRPLEGVWSAKLQQVVVELDRMAERAGAFAVDKVLCALGTTIRAAGSQAAFRRVDHEYPLEAARLALAGGATHYLLVSAMGANATSRVFYNRVKGEVERDLRALPFRSLTIARPSLLLGDRAERRLGEEVAKKLGWMIPGKYRPIQARDVAAALVRAAREDLPGVRVIESPALRAMARGGG
jgi:uncharacterized protein YbjT (DUF2867 family)